MTTPLPTVAIILVNWNGLGDTLECLGSLSGVTYPAVHVVVVDNGSTADEAGAIRAAYPAGGLLPVEVLETGANLGFTGGNNVGIGWALEQGAEYVLCLNNDTVVDPGFLEPLVQALQDEPRAGIAVSKIFYCHEPDIVWFCGGECSFRLGEMMRHGGPAWHSACTQARNALTTPYDTGIATGCSLLVRTKVAASLDGFDDRYFAYFEDTDFCLRARRQGWNCRVAPASHVWHKVGRATGGEMSPESFFYGVRNTYLLLKTQGTFWQRVWGTLYYLAVYVPQLLCPDPKKLEALIQALWCALTGRWGSRASQNALRPACARLASRLVRVTRWYWKIVGLRLRCLYDLRQWMRVSRA